MAIFSKACKPDNFESHNSLKFSFTNIRRLRSNFIDCESFLELSSPDILALCDTNMDDSIHSGNFSVRCYLPLIRKDSSAHMYGLTVYVREGLPFVRDLSLENSADSNSCFRLALLHSVTVTLTVLLFWIDLFLLMQVFVLQWPSLHWEVLIMFLSQFPFTFQ